MMLSQEELEVVNFLQNLSNSQNIKKRNLLDDEDSPKNSSKKKRNLPVEEDSSKNSSKKKRILKDNDFNNMNLPNNYIRDSVLYELYSSKEGKKIIKNKGLKVFLLRIWVRWLDKFLYYIGSSNDILNEITIINNDYECCGKIILISSSLIDDIAKYKKIKYSLIRFRYNSEITKLLKPKHNLYNISVNIYDLFLKYLNESDKVIFESGTYILENINHELVESIHKDWFYICDLQNLKITEKKFVLLDSSNNEKSYWNKRRNYIPQQSFI